MSPPEPLSVAILDLTDENKRVVARVQIASTSTSSGPPYPLIRIGADEASQWGEQRLQLLEGRTYDYALVDHPVGTCLRQGVFRASRLPDPVVERGAIIPEANTGLLPVVLEREDGTPLASAALEVRSAKLKYREHYRQMLDYISEKATDLLLEIRSPALLQLLPEPAHDSQTIAQQFAFLQSVLVGREFQDALRRILMLPHSHTIPDEREQDIRRGVPSNSKVAKQLNMRQPRIALPQTHPLTERLITVPTRILASHRRETTDTPENRFVKHVLLEFTTFLSNMERRISASRKQDDLRLRREITRLRGELEEALSQDLFTNVSEPLNLSLGSPVLQRRGGYREVLRTWLLFSLAASLRWDGGDDVYAGGKRDVATLYEYWLFFRLLDLFGRKFHFSTRSISELIEKTSDGFGLKLKTGQHLPIEGDFSQYGRQFKIRFSYNRTFVRRGLASEEVNYPAAGSWTHRMRPDYTLSIWPAAFNETEAETAELIVHLHFDAKYRVDKVTDFFGEDTEADLNEARMARREGRTAKRDDLLKMHAYRDAIRRTAGAYVLYPGTETCRWRGFHELLPGIGAFAVRPDKVDDGTDALSSFLDDVILHLCDRASLRERQTYHVQIVQAHSPSVPVHRSLPERTDNGKRVVPIAEQYVLMVHCGSGIGEFPIIGDIAYYYIPSGVTFDDRWANIAYVLSYADHLIASPGLRCVKGRPRLLSEDAVQIVAANAVNIKRGLYVAYELGELIIPERNWSGEELQQWGVTDVPSEPIIISSNILLAERL